VGSASYLGIRIRGETPQLRLEARGPDIGGDEHDDRQVFAPSNRLSHEGLGALASLDEEHAGHGSLAIICGAEGLDQRAAGRAATKNRPE